MTKRPTGWLIEEGGGATIHLFHEGEYEHSESDFEDYTGRFCFEFTTPLGKHIRYTRWYTYKSAPKWLKRLYDEATGKVRDE